MGQERTVLALWRSALLIKSRSNSEYDNEGDSDSDNASNSDGGSDNDGGTSNAREDDCDCDSHRDSNTNGGATAGKQNNNTYRLIRTD